jgi:hypothetical protein
LTPLAPSRSFFGAIIPQLRKFGEINVEIHAPGISHLLFADDFSVFTQASERGGLRLAEILRKYQTGSG